MNLQTLARRRNEIVTLLMVVLALASAWTAIAAAPRATAGPSVAAVDTWVTALEL